MDVDEEAEKLKRSHDEMAEYEEQPAMDITPEDSFATEGDVFVMQQVGPPWYDELTQEELVADKVAEGMMLEREID